MTMSALVASPRRALGGLLGAAALASGCATTAGSVPPPHAPVAQPAQPSPDPREELVCAGDDAFVHRADPETLEKAIATWGQAAALRDSAEVRLRLARAEHFAGQAARGGPAAAKERFERGAQQARLALSLLLGGAPEAACEPCACAPTKQTAPALYWLAENLDARSREVGLLAGAPERKQALCLARRLVEVEPGFFHAGPLRLLGRLLAQAPTNLGGDAKTSREAFERAAALSPEFLANRVDLAATVAVKVQDVAAFEAALALVLEADANEPADLAPENALAKARAARLMAEKRTLFR